MRCTAPTPSREDDGATRDPGYNAIRGARVIAKARQVLDQAAPLAMGSHRDATHYGIDAGRLTITLKDHARTGLARPEQFVGYRGDAGNPSSVLLKHNGLHIEIVLDRHLPDRTTGRRRRCRRAAGGRDHDDPGLRGLGGLRRCR